MSKWYEIIPTIDEMDVVVGTPVRFLENLEANGFPLRHDMSLTIRPWGDENDKWCMVIDDKGTSVPCPMDSLIIDLEHPLGFSATMQWTYKHLWKERHFDEIFKDRSEVQRIARGEASEGSRCHLAALVSELVDYESRLQEPGNEE
jgi:hypothetical protein